MRGEDANPWSILRLSAGSPPHARGRLPLAHKVLGCDRITPACAGKTTLMGMVSASPWDHPRMRGEDHTCVPSRYTLGGSPPHARGRHVYHEHKIPGKRITPACAGKTVAPQGATILEPDHPRMRGEDLKQVFGSRSEPGSPPHARGRPPPERRWTFVVGITPACAGKTFASHKWTATNPDHPRMRGEDTSVVSRSRAATGSPPHARGRLASFLLAIFLARITPACAGKTPARR